MVFRREILRRGLEEWQDARARHAADTLFPTLCTILIAPLLAPSGQMVYPDGNVYDGAWWEGIREGRGASTPSSPPPSSSVARSDLRAQFSSLARESTEFVTRKASWPSQSSESPPLPPSLPRYINYSIASASSDGCEAVCRCPERERERERER